MMVKNPLRVIEDGIQTGRNGGNHSLLYDVIIVGGGLSGLFLAKQINNAQIEGSRKLRWKLFEAAPRIGGRLANDVGRDGISREIDLGGAWVWPQFQPGIMKSLVDPASSLGIKTFLQPGAGYGSPRTARIVGGAVEFANKIYEELTIDGDEANPERNVRTGSPVTAVRRNSDRTISVEIQNGQSVKTKHVVFAVPPKILSRRVLFEPSLTPEKSAAMSSSQTWMAGVTKVALVYRGSPDFWPSIVEEAEQLVPPGNGRPAFQAYDGTPFSSLKTTSTSVNTDKGSTDERISVLTFFTLASLSNDEDDDEKLARDCAEQLSDSLSQYTIQKHPIMGKYIQSFDEFYVKRWPQEHYISDDPSPLGITPHPQPVSLLAKSEWDGTLLFAGSETDQRSPGVMDGAIGAAKRVAAELAKKLSLTFD